MPEVVEAGTPKKSTNTPSSIAVLWSARTPTVPPSAKDLKNRTRRAVFLNWLIAGPASIAIYQRVHAAVGDRPHEKCSGWPYSACAKGASSQALIWPVKKRTPLPRRRAQSKFSNPSTTTILFDSRARVLRKLRELAGHPSDLANHSANRALANGVISTPETRDEVEHRRAAKRCPQSIRCSSKAGSHEPRRGARQKP